jgi:hypothetical protein
MAGALDNDQLAAFERDGYVLVRGFFDAEDAALLRTAMETDPAIRAHFFDRGDADGGRTKLALWNHPGDSVYGQAARSAKLVDWMEKLLGGEVYHYHSKLTAKDPDEGGAWERHQDYGYWYKNGCLFPLMASAMIALDRCDRSNGCSAASRSAPIPNVSRRRSRCSTWSIARWTPATRCSSTATRCTAPTRTARPAATTRRATTRTARITTRATRSWTRYPTRRSRLARDAATLMQGGNERVDLKVHGRGATQRT